MRNWLNIFLCVVLAVVARAAFAQEFNLLIGTYTAKGSEGVYVYRFNAQTGSLTPLSVAKNLKNPSFLCLSPDQKQVYVVEEIAHGKVNAYNFDKKTGQMALLNSQPVNGDAPCYVTTDQTGKWVMVGNYSSGNFGLLPVQPDGSLGAMAKSIQHEGQGANPQRQEKPHVHSVNIAPNNREVFVVDLGIDKIMAYRFNAATGELLAGEPPFAQVRQGAGPRHFAFHPKQPWAYVIQELNSTITAFNYQNGRLDAFQTLGTLPADYTGPNSCADIHISPDGKFLYGSNRGNNTIVVYSIDPQTGELWPVQHQPVMGEMPRNFALDPSGNYLLVANQNTDNVTVFKRDKKTGRLTYTGQSLAVSMPVCLQFAQH